MVKEINVEQFKELLSGKKPFVCDFFATWCGPCKMLSPVLEEVSESLSDKADFVKVDIDKNFELAAEYGIMTVPCVMLFKDGNVKDKSIGYCSNEEITEFVTKNL
jgi:thioredoxin 1